MYNTHSCSYRCIMNLKCFVRHPRPPSTKCPRDETAGRRSVPATRWLATKCPRATKWLETKCPSDEMASDEASPRRNGLRRNGGDKMRCTHKKSRYSYCCYCLHLEASCLICHRQEMNGHNYVAVNSSNCVTRKNKCVYNLSNPGNKDTLLIRTLQVYPKPL